MKNIFLKKSIYRFLFLRFNKKQVYSSKEERMKKYENQEYQRCRRIF